MTADALRLVTFQWPVPAAGVRVVQGEGMRFTKAAGLETQTGAFLVPIGREIGYSNPLEQRSELLPAFANAPLDDEGLVKLVNRWGLLGSGDPERPWFKVTVEAPSAEVFDHGDLVSESRAVLEEWRDAFALWNACTQPERASYLTEKLASRRGGETSRLRVTEGEAVYLSGEVRIDDAIAGRRVLRIGGTLAPYVTPRKPLLAAKLVLHRIIDEKLKQLMLFGADFALATETPLPRGRPKSLLGALWFALLEAWAGGLHARRCPRCRNWFVADPGRERRDARIYCRATCRVAMADKRARSLALAADGKKAPSIAKALGQDVKTIRAWLRDSGKKKRR